MTSRALMALGLLAMLAIAGPTRACEEHEAADDRVAAAPATDDPAPSDDPAAEDDVPPRDER